MDPSMDKYVIKVRVVLLKDTETFTTYSKTLKEIGWGLLIYTSDTRRTTATAFHITFSVTLLQATVCSISRKTFQFHCPALLAISVKMLELWMKKKIMISSSSSSSLSVAASFISRYKQKLERSSSLFLFLPRENFDTIFIKELVKNSLIKGMI